ncbi:MAG: rhodanese-like domain-containing protein [Xanthomonadaceae bacterium]|nr:rhodanese-like domain-containing protein [Xanthomonadaceae bacterium]
MQRVLSRTLLVLALFAAAGAPLALAQEPGISPQGLALAIENGQAPLILDVRTPEEFARGHVPGAILIPHDQLAERLSELGGATEVVLYCHSGRRATLVEGILIDAGIGVSQIEGNWLGWQAAGLDRKYPTAGADK